MSRAWSNRDEIAYRARLIVAEALNVSPTRINDDAEFAADLGADSLDLVEIPAALEEAFGIVLTDDEVAFCKTFGTAIDVIEAKLENGAR